MESWTEPAAEHLFQQVQFRSALSMLLCCLHADLPPYLYPHPPHPPHQDPLSSLCLQSSVSSSQVKKQRLNQNQAAGPHGVSLRAEQLCGVLQHLFNLSLSQDKVPELWKIPCLEKKGVCLHLRKYSSYPPIISIYNSLC